MRHLRYRYAFDDLFLNVFVLVDDWLKHNRTRFRLPVQRSQVASYSELFTIALVGELLAQPFESVWYWTVTQNCRHLFPRLPEYTRYHRITRNAERLWAELAVFLADAAADSATYVIDAKPLPVAKGKRHAWAKMPEARKGFSTMGMVYGFKLHALAGSDGCFKKWCLAPADAHEAAVAPGLLERSQDKVVVGDKAYVGVEGVTAPKRENMQGKDGWTASLDRVRKRVETSFCVLVRSLTLHVAQVKTFWSLRAKVNLKIAAHNLMHSSFLPG